MSVQLEIKGQENVMRKLKSCGINTVKAIVSETNRTATEMENYEKSNRPWTDRTGEARRRLYAVTVIAPNTIKIITGHGVEYGIHLETKHGGRYRIIKPAVNTYRTKWINNLNSTLRG